ncbi:MAG: hypothetical protein ACYTFY_12440 [Planctomycetota bacterium]
MAKFTGLTLAIFTLFSFALHLFTTAGPKAGLQNSFISSSLIILYGITLSIFLLIGKLRITGSYDYTPSFLEIDNTKAKVKFSRKKFFIAIFALIIVLAISVLIYLNVSDRRETDFQKLYRIQLPQYPTTFECQKYINEIIDATGNPDHASPLDVQVDLYKAVGRKRINLLIAALRDNSWPVSSHLIEAIKALAGEDHKLLILRSLKDKEDLIEVVIEKGWVNSVRKLIIRKISLRDHSLSLYWFEAAVFLKDPVIYDDLKWHLINNPVCLGVFEKIQALPGIKLGKTVSLMWGLNKKSNDEWKEKNNAEIALRYGHKDALELLINSLGTDKYKGYSRDHHYSLIQNFTKYRYDNSENLKEWYKKNKANIVFNKETRKYEVKK